MPDSTYMRSVEESNTQRRKEQGYQVLAGGSNGALALNGDRVSVWEDGKFLGCIVVMIAQQKERGKERM